MAIVEMMITSLQTMGLGSKMRHFMISLAVFVFTLGGNISASAETLSEVPSCFSGFGAFWGEKSPSVRMREIDGDAIKTVADFARKTGMRERGLKVVKGGDFSGWDFRKIPLHQICFQESNLSGANLAGAKGTGIGFVKSDLTGADMRGAIMPKVHFRNANLTNVMAQKANFHGGHFDGGWFEGGLAGWNLDGATMTEFQFECGITLSDGCPVYQGGDRISARGTDFTRATLHSFGLFDIPFDGAILDDTVIGPAQLPALKKADWRGNAILRGGKDDIPISREDAKLLIAENAKVVEERKNPSFDCRKASSKVELEICGEYSTDLRALDRDIAVLYRRAIDTGKMQLAKQRAWLKSRNRCNAAEYVRDCLTSSYEDRKAQLLGALGPSDWLAAEVQALFVDEVLPLPDAFKETALFVRITPALVGASMTDILVTGGENGLFSIKGQAVGANAHLCSVEADMLYFDKATGWYSVVTEGSSIPVFQLMDGRLNIFKNGRADSEIYPEASNYAGCGMRASFQETVRISVDAATLARYRESYEEEM